MAENNRDQAIIDRLGDVLAGGYTLQIKTHNFHWNVTGPHFAALHALFEAQYNEVFLANDLIAERIRALDDFAPGSLAQFAKRSPVPDAPDRPPAHEAMIAALADDHERLSAVCAELQELADDAGDTATGDLMNGRIAAHDKHAWMLRAQLD